ncbi:MAG: hypothetical protein AWM53_00277 [Candidatus Dichloromethanomonas elyunquensis]|nr:MAG: hypothetical protein AWM53_00277 [Candidatus Dichloromethanomonas elyunquensis]
MESVNGEIKDSLVKARSYVLEGGEQILRGGLDEAHRLSISPGATALAALTQLLLGNQFKKSHQAGLAWLRQNRCPQGWSKVPNGESDPEITRLVQKVLLGSYSGKMAKYFLPGQANELANIVLALGQQVVAGMEGPQPQETKLPYILSDHVLNKLPPYGRPVVIAASLLAVKNLDQFGASQAAAYLCDHQLEDGSWCEDVVATSLSALALVRARVSGEQIIKAGKWLQSKQYPRGGWPAFDQLQIWSTGLTIYTFVEFSQSPEERDFLNRAAKWLADAQYSDGSYGSTPPFTQPDLDDTAVALLGLQLFNRVSSDQAAETLRRLQNKDGSWSTFPNYDGVPPALNCMFPVYIRSTDVTIHALDALIGMPGNNGSLAVSLGLRWLLSQQLPSGEIPAVWYESPVYATAQALELLNKWVNQVNPRGISQYFYNVQNKLFQYLVSSQNTDGSWGASVIETSLALSALSLHYHRLPPATLAKGVSYILSRQAANGSFQPSYQGVYAKGWNYEEPLTTALTAIKAMERYNLLTDKGQ